ncbi:MAG: HD domain-containing protein [Clostridia bacterium]|nr:HD domain-containing protein [Clostridia bacterium]
MKDVYTFINQLRDKVSKYFGEDASGHNTDHLERTLKYALYLQSKEGGDIIVIGISAFIHDVHRILGTKYNRFVSPKESLPIVSTFIEDLDVTTQQKQHILHAIEHHEEYSFGKDGINVNDIESKILQDADNLDAIGAMGIVRALKYGFAHNIPDYEPSIPLYQNEYEEKNNDISTIHHINNKLIRLGDHMNTTTAKNLAQKKIDLMKQFMNMYINESTGKF